MSEGIFYKDESVAVTRAMLENGGSSYPISTIARVVRPIQDPFELFEGFLLNAGVVVFGLYGVSNLSTGWVIVGLLALLIGGFNVWGQFRRYWWISVEFVNGQKIRIQDLSKQKIFDIYEALRRAIDPD